ncbi:MAG TPA: ABC transporter permease [Acidimicrobiales bacterium]|nr:ABC transporter permease [Acidimicrobiales bacterium]
MILKHLLTKGLPLGIVLLGVIYGSIYALLAMGIVLVYRGNRIINFAQAQIGVIGAILAIEMNVTYGINFVLSCLIGIVAAVVIGAILSLLPRHFRKSSRLILTVATIGLAQALTGISAILPILFCNPANNSSCTTAAAHQTFNTPLHSQFTIFPVVFSGNDIVAFLGTVVIVVALALFMRRSRYGLAIRAASENGERATLLGVPVPRLDTIIWIVAALLSTVAILLQTPVLGFGGFQTVSTTGDDVLIRILAAAVIGRMESMPRTAVAAIAIGVFDAGATWTYSNTTFVDATLVIVIIGALLIQRKSYTRSAESEQSTWRSVVAVRPIPRALAALPEVRWSIRGSKLALAAVAILLPFMISDSQTYLASIILIYAIVGLSLLVLTGWTGQISLGQFGIAGLAGAVAADLYSRHGWDFFAALAVAVVVGALVALVIGVPALRIQGPFLAVTTLAFGVCASVYLLSPSYLTWLVTTSANRPSIFGDANRLSSDSDIYYFCLIGFFLCLMAVRSLRRSRIGRSLIATRDNEAAARASALNTTRQKLIAFLISGAIAGFAGALFVVQQQGVNNGSFTADIDIALFTMVVIGGLGSLPGVVVGAVAVWSALYFLPPGWALLVNGGGILLLLIFLPEGLGGVMYRARDGLLGLVARRRHLTNTGLHLGDQADEGQVGEGILVSTAAAAAEHLEAANRAGPNGELLADAPAPSRSGAGGGHATVSSGGPPSVLDGDPGLAAPDVRGPSAEP